jgi:hypothetical protein
MSSKSCIANAVDSDQSHGNFKDGFEELGDGVSGWR